METIYNVVGYKKNGNKLELVNTGWRTNSLSKAIFLAKISEATRKLLFYEVVGDDNGVINDSVCYFSTDDKKSYLENNCIEFLSNFKIVEIFDNCVKLSNENIDTYLYCYYKNNNFDRPIAGVFVYEEEEDVELNIDLSFVELNALQRLLDSHKFPTNKFGYHSISDTDSKTIEALEECIDLIKECDDCFCSEDGIVYVDQHSALEILRNKIKELKGE